MKRTPILLALSVLVPVSAARAAWTVDKERGSIHDGPIEIGIEPDPLHEGGIVLKKVWQAPKGDWSLDSLPRVEADTGLRPTAIEGSFAAWHYGLRSFALPDTVRSIGRAAFYSCENATNALALPSQLEELGRAAFMGCKNLRGDVAIPAGVRVVGMEAFYGCAGLTGLSFAPGSRLERIDTLAFKRCSGIRGTVDFSPCEALERIDPEAFIGCTPERAVFGEPFRRRVLQSRRRLARRRLRSNRKRSRRNLPIRSPPNSQP